MKYKTSERGWTSFFWLPSIPKNTCFKEDSVMYIFELNRLYQIKSLSLNYSTYLSLYFFYILFIPTNFRIGRQEALIKSCISQAQYYLLDREARCGNMRLVINSSEEVIKVYPTDHYSVCRNWLSRHFTDRSCNVISD